MAKRLTDSEKWNDPWFRKLTPPVKLLWLYLCDACDHAGIWKCDPEIAEFMIGMKVDWETAKEELADRIDTHRKGYWLIVKFMTFQYGYRLHRGRAVKGAFELLEEKGFDKGLIRVKEGIANTFVRHKAKATATAKAMAKAVVKDVKDVEVVPPGGFETLWEAYPKKKGRHDAQRHFKAQVKTMRDWLDIQNALENFKRELKKNGTEERYIPHGSTWFNNRWRDDVNYGGSNDGQRRDGVEGVYHESDLKRRAREAQGLRKADFPAPARKILDAVRHGTVHEAPGEKPE